MKNLKLVIGDRNLSSWSMRAWLALKAAELPFEEILIPLDQPSTKAALEKHSPSLKVPCLIHSESPSMDLRIWDSLAICEYIHELAPEKNLWPKNPEIRALARAYTAEMHSGFSSLRGQLSMDIRLRMQARHLVPQTLQDIRRIVTLWEDALQKFKGPFLFGGFSIADAFYAPIVFRFLSYGIQIESKLALKYMEEIQKYPFVKEWVSKALEEKYESPRF